MKNLAKFYHRAAALLLCFCLVAMGSADVYAICFSESHHGGSAIHEVTHEAPSAERQGNRQKCGADQFSDENHCVDVLLTSPVKNIQAPATVHLPAITGSGFLLDADAMARFFSRRPAIASLFPAPSPPIILQTQTFLN